MKNRTILAALVLAAALGLAGCGTSAEDSAGAATASTVASAESSLEEETVFTDRDLEQTADTADAVYYSLADGQDITITEAGVYVLSGSAKEATVIIAAGDDDKVQLVLDGVAITNTDFPAIYVKSADKVFVTTAEGSESSLTVTGAFKADGDVNTDAVIFAKDDLVLNGTGSLTIKSSANGITSKDSLKITGGTYDITSAEDAIEAHDAIAIAQGNFTINAGKDAFHSEYDEDESVGSVYIADGTFAITAGDDGIQGTTITRIDGGSFTIAAAEGIEGTQVEINGGTFDIRASDDGINAAQKSVAYAVQIEINGGDITIVMGTGDTDGVDSNGDLTITGGTISVTGQSSFDYDGTATYTGGTIIVNGTQVDSIPQSPMGGGAKGGH